MRLHRKIVLPAIIVVIAITVIVYLLVTSHKTPDAPIKYSFSADSGEIAFTIDEGYKIHCIQVLEGNFDVPYYDEKTKSISFPALNLDIGEHEFVYFVVQNLKGKVTEEYNIEYEILHQSKEEIILSIRNGKSPNPGISDMHSFYY